MTTNPDGNTAALRAYEREQDALSAAEQALEQARSCLADDLRDAYVSGNHAVIDELDDWLSDYPWTERMREAMTAECERPIMGRGCIAYKALERAISESAEAVAGRVDDIDEFRRGFGL